MNRTGKLASVSVFALLTAAGAGGVRADALFDLNIAVPTVEAGAVNSVLIEVSQPGILTTVDATNQDTEFGVPLGSDAHDYGGGTNAPLVDKNVAFAEAFSNGETSSIDLFAADGKANFDAATIAVLQLTAGEDITTIDATTTATSHISAIDLGAGSSAKVTDNTHSATVAVNASTSRIAGIVNKGLAGGEPGQSTAMTTGTPNELESSALALVATAQIMVAVDTPAATATDNFVSLQAVSDDKTTALVGSILDVTGNAITAGATGNNAAGVIDIKAGGAVTFPGTAGVSNLQYAVADGAGDSLSAVSGGRIDIGVNAGTPTAALDGSTATLAANRFEADTTGNTAFNQVSLAAGISLDGTTAAASQVNSTTGSVQSDVAGDLFVHSSQTGLLPAYASVATVGMGVNTQNLAGSTVTVGDGDLTDPDDFGNVFSARAVGNEATNIVDVGGGATVLAIAGINATQTTVGMHVAEIQNAPIEVSVGTNTPTGIVTKSSVSVDGNKFSTDVGGNRQSSTMTIAGNTVSGGGVLGTPSLTVNRSAPGDAIEADFSVLSAQVFDGLNVNNLSMAWNLVSGAIFVDLVDQGGAAGSLVSGTTLTIASNEFSAVSIGNLSSRTGIDIDAGASFTGTLGVINDQTVMNEVFVSSSASGNGSTIEVHVTPAALTGTDIAVTDNEISGKSWGNLAQANSFSVDGVTVGDGDSASTLPPGVSVNRSSDTVPITTGSASLAMLSDQSVEDLETGGVGSGVPLSGILVEAAAVTFSNNKLAVDRNSWLGTSVINQAVSKGSVTATSLDASSSLVNVQTFADEDNDGSTGGVFGSVNDNNITLDADALNADMTRSTFSVSENSAVGERYINLASNTLSIAAQTQTVTGVVAAGTEQSAVLGTDTEAFGEIVLINDQYFDDLKGFGNGVSNNIYRTDIATGGGDLVSVDARMDGNSFRALSTGNDAANAIDIDVGTFDLGKASSAGGALNGPVATLASSQRGLDIPDKAITIGGGASGNVIDMLLEGVSGDIVSTHLSTDDNTFDSLVRVNNAVNTLGAKGTSFVTPTTSTPLATVLDGTGGDDIILDKTGFAVASRQENAYNVVSTATGVVTTTVTSAATIVDSTVDANGNLVSAQARGNDSANTLTLDFVTNEAQGFVVNTQFSATSDPVIGARVLNTKVSIDADGIAVLDRSSVSVSGNDFQALASANRTGNTLTASGANVSGGSGAAPSVAVNPNLTGDIKVGADLAIINAQGSETIAGAEADGITATVTAVGVDAELDTFLTGSLTVDNNVFAAQGIIHSAGNALVIDADATVAGVGASVVSQQVITAGSTIGVSANSNGTRAAVVDLDAAGAAAVSVDNNQMLGVGIGGIATNILTVDAGAAITGAVAAPVPVLGTATGQTTASLNADFNILNLQLGDATSIAASTTGGTITNVVSGGAGLSNDVLTVDNNLVQAQVIGFRSTNVMTLTTKASSDATGIVANRQLVDGTALSASASTTIEANANAASNSSMTVSDNGLVATATVNAALNALAVDAGSTLQEASGAGGVIDPASASALSVTGAEYSVLNWQTITDGTTASSAISASTIGIDAVTGAVDVSALTVDGNQVLAHSIGNDAVNQLVLNSGTFQHPSAAVASAQTTSGATVSASVADVGIGIGLGGGNINATSSNSSLRVNGNTIGAIAVGNQGVNSISSGD